MSATRDDDRPSSPVPKPARNMSQLVVITWTGARAVALQAAARKSQEAFAEYLGVGARTVAKWHQTPAVELRPATSELLDSALRQVDEGTRERFALLVSSQPG